MGPTLPSGVVTFLFTDIEGSTRLWESHTLAMEAALPRHDALLHHAIEAHHGVVIKSTGDGLYAVFNTALDALNAALAAQRALFAEPWDPVLTTVDSRGRPRGLRVRMGIHTGIADERGGDYFGPPLNRTARLMAVGHGGQVLLSQASLDQLKGQLPPNVEIRDLGERRLRDLTRPEHIYQAITAHLLSDFPPLNTLDAHPNNLPAQLTPFIAREQEVRAVQQLLLREDVRLVTLTGPGGVGKTRLGLQVAADMIDIFEHGVYFVGLAPISNPALVVPTIAEALGVHEEGGRPRLDSLRDYLRDKRLLLLLDNFEQVLAAAVQITQLMSTCPHLKLLITSRSVLHVRGEREFSLLPLPVPDLKRLPPIERLAQYDAVRLFLDRAQDANADYVMTAEDAPAVAEICARLDGLPLAIELAAARVKLLPPAALLPRLSNRLKLLTRGARDLPARQQTMRGAIAWSYELLDPAERVLFARQAVFVGGFDLEAVEAVCNADGDLEIDPLDGLTSLVDKSLVRRVEGRRRKDEVPLSSSPSSEEPRFMLLETIREYAWEQLTASGTITHIRDAHAAFFLNLAEQAEPQLRGLASGAWLDRLEQELDNLRATLAWSQEGYDEDRHGLGLRLAGALWRFWYFRGHWREGRTWLEACLHQSEGDSGTRVKALNGAGNLAYAEGDYAAAETFHAACLAMRRAAGDKPGIADSLRNLGNVAWNRADMMMSRQLFTESLALQRELRDKQGMALALHSLGEVARVQGNYDEAQTAYTEALELFRQSRTKQGIAWTFHSLGMVATDLGDFVSAEALSAQALDLFRELGDQHGAAAAMDGQGTLAVARGDLAEGQARVEESLAIFRELGGRHEIAATLTHLAEVMATQGELQAAADYCCEGLELSAALGDRLVVAQALAGLGVIAAACNGQGSRAARLLAIASVLRQTLTAAPEPIQAAMYTQAETAARAALGDTDFAAAWAEGQAMTMEMAVAFALETHLATTE